MDRIAESFSRAKKEGRACFVAYVCAGDPDFETSLAICRTLVECGVDVIELGTPFSDPLADGPTNQLAAQRALASGMTSERVFELVERIREFSEVPVVLYTYYNLIFARGEKEYVERAARAGVDGLLTLDLPPEEAGNLVSVSRDSGIKNIFIIAPTTPPERIRTVAASASGFLYYVSREGVTGVRSELAGNLEDAVAAVRKETSMPLVVGFGISSGEQVRRVGALADGVVVGSALVNCVKDNLGSREAILDALRERMKDLRGG